MHIGPLLADGIVEAMAISPFKRALFAVQRLAATVNPVNSLPQDSREYWGIVATALVYCARSAFTF